ncbi:hypothetical protein STENM36S_03787 [Streptomyces tendae]
MPVHRHGGRSLAGRDGRREELDTGPVGLPYAGEVEEARALFQTRTAVSRGHRCWGSTVPNVAAYRAISSARSGSGEVCGRPPSVVGPDVLDQPGPRGAQLVGQGGDHRGVDADDGADVLRGGEPELEVGALPGGWPRRAPRGSGSKRRRCPGPTAESSPYSPVVDLAGADACWLALAGAGRGRGRGPATGSALRPARWPSRAACRAAGRRRRGRRAGRPPACRCGSPGCASRGLCCRWRRSTPPGRRPSARVFPRPSPARSTASAPHGCGSAPPGAARRRYGRRTARARGRTRCRRCASGSG